MSQKAMRAAQRKRQKQLKLFAMIGAGGLLLLLAAVWVISLAKPTPTAAIEVSGSPSLKVDKESEDLGYIKLGKTVDVSFLLTNVGDQPLKLSEAPYVEVVQGC